MLKREIAVTFAGSLAATAVGLGTTIVFARVLGRDGQGLLALALFVPSILATFCPFGMDAVNATFGGLHKEQRRGLFLQSVLVSLFSGVISVVVIGAFFFWLPVERGQFGRLPSEVVWLSCLATPLTVLSGTLSSLVRGVGRITTSAVLGVVTPAATLVLALALLVGLRYGLTAALVAAIAGQAVNAGISVWILRDYATLRPSQFSWALLKKSLGLGWQISVATLGSFLIYRVNQGILGYEATADQIGLFVVAVGLAERLRMVPNSLGLAFLPRLANELATRQGQVPAVFRYSVLVSVASMAAVGVAGVPAILLFFGWAYAGSILPFLIMLPGVAALGGASVMASDLLTRGKPKYDIMICYSVLACNVVLNVLLIPILGITGAALTSSISYGMALVLWVGFYRYESKVPLANLVPRGADVAYVYRGVWQMAGEMFQELRLRFGRGTALVPPGEGMPGPRPVAGPKVLVTGQSYWHGVAAAMLRQAGFDACTWRTGPESVPAVLRWCRPLRIAAYLLGRQFRQAAVIHNIGAVPFPRFIRLARWLGKRVVQHWVGTDVLVLKEAVAKGDRRLLQFYQKVPHCHFVDSPELTEELADLGIRPELFRLLPDSVLPTAEVPLPERPAVLAYWSHDRRAFYGGPIVDALAEEFRDVTFYVVGSDGAGEPQHPNMKYLGRLDGLEDVYRSVGVLVRMPEHDSLSAMVLEMLARGRWVIYSKPFPHTETATNLDEAREALRRCLAGQGPNREGQEYVRQNFSPSHEAERITPIYNRILYPGGPEGRGQP
jgi:O-antigen/teichoic acid export membrane protein